MPGRQLCSPCKASGILLGSIHPAYQYPRGFAGFPNVCGKGGFLALCCIRRFPHRLRRSDLNLPLLLICLACDIVSLSLLDLCRIKLIYRVDDELDVAEEVVNCDTSLSDGNGTEGTVQRRKRQN